MPISLYEYPFSKYPLNEPPISWEDKTWLLLDWAKKNLGAWRKRLKEYEIEIEELTLKGGRDDRDTR